MQRRHQKSEKTSQMSPPAVALRRPISCWLTLCRDAGMEAGLSATAISLAQSFLCRILLQCEPPEHPTPFVGSCLLVASKSELGDQVKTARQLAEALIAHISLIDAKDRSSADQGPEVLARALLAGERPLLVELGFRTTYDCPLKRLVTRLKEDGRAGQVAQDAWNFVVDALCVGLQVEVGAQEIAEIAVLFAERVNAVKDPTAASSDHREALVKRVLEFVNE
jgi:hypothetical protein